MSAKDRLSEVAGEAGEFPDYPIIEWEIGTVVSGEIDNIREVHAHGDDVLIADIDDEDRGRKVSVFVTPTRLKTEWEKVRPQIGDLIYIEQYGTDPAFRDMKLYKMAVEREGKLLTKPPEAEDEAEDKESEQVPF